MAYGTAGGDNGARQAKKKFRPRHQVALMVGATALSLMYAGTVRWITSVEDKGRPRIYFYWPFAVMVALALYLWVPKLISHMPDYRFVQIITETSGHQNEIDIASLSKDVRMAGAAVNWIRLKCYSDRWDAAAVFICAFMMLGQLSWLTLYAGGVRGSYTPLLIECGGMAVRIARKKIWGCLILVSSIICLVVVSRLNTIYGDSDVTFFLITAVGGAVVSVLANQSKDIARWLLSVVYVAKYRKNNG
jgi:hypothetical protein